MTWQAVAMSLALAFLSACQTPRVPVGLTRAASVGQTAVEPPAMLTLPPREPHWPRTMRRLRDDLVAVRSWLTVTHLLVDGDRLILVDTGLFGDFPQIQAAVAALGRQPSDLKAILVTHGHLDHTGNAARLQRWSGASVYAPAADRAHVAGTHPYRGASRGCGWLEQAGRVAMGFQPPHVDEWFADGTELPFWGGLRVVALPGHTVGHCGFLSESKRVLFVGDVFDVTWHIGLPPAIFNDDSAGNRASFRRVAAMDVDLFVPGHYSSLTNLPARLRQKAARLPPEKEGGGIPGKGERTALDPEE